MPIPPTTFSRDLSKLCSPRDFFSTVTDLGKTKTGDQLFNFSIVIRRAKPECTGKVVLCAAPPVVFTKTTLENVRKLAVCEQTGLFAKPCNAGMSCWFYILIQYPECSLIPGLNTWENTLRPAWGRGYMFLKYLSYI